MAAVAISTAEAVNTLAEGTAAALQTQTQLNAHLQAYILIINQRVDLIQEQLDLLGEIMGLGRIAPFSAICVTPVTYKNTSEIRNTSLRLSQYLQGNWSAEFQSYTQHLLIQITRINNTRVDIVTLPEMLKILKGAFTFTKEWASLFGVVLLLLVGIILLARKMLAWRRQQQEQQRVIVQALAALQTGTSAQVWLSMLDR